MEQDLRGKILAASVALLEEQGVSGLSMREVARRAGVSHQAPYHHFADRSAILAAIAKDGFAELARRTRTAKERPARSFGERAERVGIEYVEFALARPAYFRLMFRPELVDEAAREDVAACGHEAFAVLQELVREWIAEGHPAAPSEEAVTAATWSVTHGLACLMLDGPLAIKIPSTAEARTETVRSVMRVLRGWIEATVAAAKQPKTKRRRGA